MNSIDAWHRHLVQRQFAKLRHGRLTVHEAGRCMTFGQGDDLSATIRVHHPRGYRRLFWSGDLGAAESLLDGDWSSDDLTAVARLFTRNQALLSQASGVLGMLGNLRSKLKLAARRNTRRGSAKNIRQHYDLGNDFFELFLDPTMSYSCGMFEPVAEGEAGSAAELSNELDVESGSENAKERMHAASLAKLDRACRALELSPRDHLLEIGSGWGGLAVHAARNYGCHVTTATISPAQFQFVKERVRAAGLKDRVTVLLSDYRDLTGQFDKLVSIEMIEAVGHQYFETFFAQCSRLLKPRGLMLLQSIVISDHLFSQHVGSANFINQYIFPGGCLPSVAAMLSAVSKVTDQRCVYLEDFAPHYAETLRHWRGAFHARLNDVRRLGFDERFVRMWNYYLCYCEAAFEERAVNLVQMLLAKPGARRVLLPVEKVFAMASNGKCRGTHAGRPSVSTLVS